MDFGFWWLLIIPVVFSLGWVAARLDLKHLLTENAHLPRSYFRGLNFLLNEQPDKAIDAFIEIVKLDPETVELHFALGSLFRRRGETERAVRIHQNLLNRADLPAPQRDHASYELGRDFLKAGLLDRAQQTFDALIQSQAYKSEAQQCLLTIYSLEKDWGAAIGAAKALEALGVRSYKKEVAQFYCERAQEALQRFDAAAARAALEKALAINPENVRATLLLGDVEAAADPEPSSPPALDLHLEPSRQHAPRAPHNPISEKKAALNAAIEQWKRVEKQNPAYLPLVAGRLMQAYSALGQPKQGLALLRDYLKCYPSSRLLDIIYPYLVQYAGAATAYALMREQMQIAPSLIGMMRLILIEAHLAAADKAPRRELEALRPLIDEHIQNLARYRCQSCGFQARLFYWQCPGCNGWETYI